MDENDVVRWPTPPRDDAIDLAWLAQAAMPSVRLFEGPSWDVPDGPRVTKGVPHDLSCARKVSSLAVVMPGVMLENGLVGYALLARFPGNAPARVLSLGAEINCT